MTNQNNQNNDLTFSERIAIERLHDAAYQPTQAERRVVHDIIVNIICDFEQERAQAIFAGGIVMSMNVDHEMADFLGLSSDDSRYRFLDKPHRFVADALKEHRIMREALRTIAGMFAADGGISDDAKKIATKALAKVKS